MKWRDITPSLDDPPKSWESVLGPGERVGGPSEWGNSRWSHFAQCPYLEYVESRYKRTHLLIEEPLEVGGLYHEVRSLYYAGLCESGNTMTATLKACDLIDRVKPISPIVANKVQELFSGWLRMVEQTPRFAPEVEWFRVRRPDPTKHLELLVQHKAGRMIFPYSCRLDVLWGDPGDVRILEIKTGRERFLANILDGYRGDPQFLGQNWLYRRRLSSTLGALREFQVDLTLKGTPLHSYRRESISFPDRLLRSWLSDLIRLQSMRMEEYEGDGLPTKLRNNCVRYAARCHLWDHCCNPTAKSLKALGWVKRV